MKVRFASLVKCLSLRCKAEKLSLLVDERHNITTKKNSKNKNSKSKTIPEVRWPNKHSFLRLAEIFFIFFIFFLFNNFALKPFPTTFARTSVFWKKKRKTFLQAFEHQIQEQIGSGERRLLGVSPTGSPIWAKVSSIVRAAGCPSIFLNT